MNPDYCQMSPKQETTVGERDYYYGRRDELANVLEALLKSYNGDWKKVAAFVLELEKP